MVRFENTVDSVSFWDERINHWTFSCITGPWFQLEGNQSRVFAEAKSRWYPYQFLRNWSQVPWMQMRLHIGRILKRTTLLCLKCWERFSVWPFHQRFHERWTVRSDARLLGPDSRRRLPWLRLAVPWWTLKLDLFAAVLQKEFRSITANWIGVNCIRHKWFETNRLSIVFAKRWLAGDCNQRVHLSLRYCVSQMQEERSWPVVLNALEQYDRAIAP